MSFHVSKLLPDLTTPFWSSKLVTTSTLTVVALIVATIMPCFWRSKLAFAGKVCINVTSATNLWLTFNETSIAM